MAGLFFRLDVIEIRVPPLRKLTPLAGGRRQDRGCAQEVREDLRVPHVRERRHAFFAVDRPQYRVHAAVDGWKKVFAWFEKHLR